MGARCCRAPVAPCLPRPSPHPRRPAGGAYVGGVWEEDRSWRQYAIFLDGTGGCRAKNGLVAHISAEGGPSPGQQYCRSRACGATTLEPGVWHCLANSYDGAAIRAYVNGTLDTNATSVGPNPQAGSDPDNPFLYPNPPRFPNGGIFTPPTGGGAEVQRIMMMDLEVVAEQCWDGVMEAGDCRDSSSVEVEALEVVV